MDTRNFFSTIFGAGVGYAVLSTDLGAGKDVWFQYPAQLDDMVKWAEDRNQGQVYFSPVLYTDQVRDKAHAKTVSVSYSDSDVFDPHKYRIPPSVTIETAPGRTHNYWLLDGDYNPHVVALVNRRAHWAHKGEGLDSSFGHAAKMLRVPGSTNLNRDGAPVHVLNNTGKVYTLAELEAAYPVDGAPEKVYGTDRPLPTTLPNRMELLANLTDNKFIRNLLFDEPIPGKRSEMRYKLEGELFRMGYSAEEVLALVWEAPCCKYKQEGRPIGHLWQEIVNAEVDPANLPHVPGAEIPSVDGEALVKLLETVEPANFLSDQERNNLSATFIDRYTTWATSHTTSPAKYHRSMALIIMSAVYAEYGHIPFDFQKTNLAIWVMPLGNTTVDRKTTALQYGTDFLEALETTDYTYDIGSDVTQQGLNKLLADRANQSSLLHADEVQDVFKEVFSQGYLTGLIGYWTQLYSGKSRGTVRSTGEKLSIKAVPVNFLMYLTGIITHVTDELSIKHFESGFLTRFIYVLVEPRPYDPSADLLKQSPATNVNYVDSVRNGLITHIAEVRNYWGMRGTRDKTHPIRFTDEALERLNAFSIQIKRLIMSSPRFETLKGPIERLVITVAKTSALFAMDNKRNIIELVDVLEAVSLAEEWYDDLIKIAGMISESGWQRDLLKLEHFIAAKGGRSTYELAYKQFPDKRPQEFKEMVDGLEDMGRIINRRTNTSSTLEILYDAG